MTLDDLLSKKNWNAEKIIYFFFKTKEKSFYDINNISIACKDLLFSKKHLSFQEQDVLAVEQSKEFNHFDFLELLRLREASIKSIDEKAHMFLSHWKNENLKTDYEKDFIKIFIGNTQIHYDPSKISQAHYLFSDGSYKKIQDKEFITLAGVITDKDKNVLATICGNGKDSQNYEKDAIALNLDVAQHFQLKNLTLMTDSRTEYDIINRFSQGFVSRRVLNFLPCYQKIGNMIQEGHHQCFFIFDEYNQFCDKITKSIFHAYEKEHLKRSDFYFNEKINFHNHEIRSFHGIFELDHRFIVYQKINERYFLLDNLSFDEISEKLKKCFIFEQESTNAFNIFSKNPWNRELLFPIIVQNEYQSTFNCQNTLIHAILMRKKEIPEQYADALGILDKFLENNALSLWFQNNKKNLIDMYKKDQLSKKMKK